MKKILTMKKTFVTASVLGALISANSFARTEGHYIGLDFINTNVQNIETLSTTPESSTNSFGINYKYAYNINNVFIAPGIFHDDNRADLSSGTDTAELRYSHGIKLDLGYDITDQVAFFVTAGFSENRITTNISNVTTDSSKEALIYGVGARYSVNGRVSINVAYEVADFQGTDPAVSSVNSNGSDYKVLRVGVAYNF